MSDSIRFDRIEEKIDSLEAKVHDIDKSLIVAVHQLDNHLNHYSQAIQAMSEAIKELNTNWQENNHQLEVHIAGVKAAQENNEILRQELRAYKESTDKRLSDAEAPSKFLKMTKSVALWVSAVGAAIAFILKMI